MGVNRIDYMERVWQPQGPAAKPAEQPQQPQPLVTENRDVCDISPDWEQGVDWSQKVNDYLEQLKASYGDVDISIADLNKDHLQNAAAAMGPGAHLVLSNSFLQRMASGAESFYKGKNLLDGLVKQLSGQGRNGAGVGAYVDDTSATFWSAQPKKEEERPWENWEPDYTTLIETMKRLEKEAKERKEKFTMKISNSLFDSPAEALGKLARASTVGHVKEAMAMAERSICTLKLALALGPDKDKAKLRAAISALQKVAGRGSRKIRDLNEEDDLRYRQKRAQEEQRRRRAEQLRYELKQREVSRRAREHAQITEGQPWFYYQEELMGRRRIPTREELAGVDPAVFAAMDAGTVALEGGGAAEGGFAPCDVTVSPSVEISI